MSYLSRSSWIPRFGGAASVAAACGILGWSVSQHHSLLALAPVAILGILALILVLSAIGWKALWLWPPMSVVLYPLAGHLPGGKYVTFDRVWIVGMIGLLLSQPSVREHARASRRMMLGFCVLVAVLGVRAIVTPATSLYPIRVAVDSLVLPLILFALVRRMIARDERSAERMALSLVQAGCLLGLIGIAEHFLGFSLAAPARFDGNIGEVRIAGPYGAPETYGLALVMCLAATLYWLLGRRRTGAALTFGVVAVLLELVAIFYTYFRVGWISALLVMLAAFALRPGRGARAIASLSIAGLALIPLFLAFETLPAVKKRVDNTQNIYVRLATYEEGWAIFKSAPLFGVGSQRYTDVANTLPPFYASGQPDQPYPHSSLFEVMAEDGLVGLIALVIAGAGTWRLIRTLGRASRRGGADALFTSVLIAAAVSYLIYSLTLTMLPYDPSNEMFAILLGIAAGRLDHFANSNRGADVSAPVVRTLESV